LTDIKKIDENGPETPSPKFAEVKDYLRTVSDVMGEYIYSMRIFPGGQMQWEWGLGAIQEITGYNEVEFRKTGGYFPLLHPQDRYDEKSHLEALLKDNPQSMEARLVTRTGETRWVKVLEYPQRDTEQRQVARILVILQDIHSQKSVRQALQESRQYQNFFENSPFSCGLRIFQR